MGIGFMVLNAVLMGGIVVVIAGGLLWAIATQHRDHGVASAGPLFRRWMWSRSRRAATVRYRREPTPAW